MAPNAAARALRREQPLLTSFRWVGKQLFLGYVVDLSNLKTRFVVEILADGYPITVIRADQLARELAREKIGDGCYGFAVTLRADLLRDCACVEARLANLGALVGTPIFLDELGDEAEAPSVGEAQWLGGLRFSGWLENSSDPAPIGIEVDGLLVDRVRCANWRHLGTPENARPVRGFDFHLPSRFADGLVHRLVAVTARGQTLDGCPLSFLAYPPGLAGVEADREESPFDRADQGLDRSAAISVPFSDYRLWRQKYRSAEGVSPSIQIAVLLFGRGEANDTLESLRDQSHQEWAAISLKAAARPAATSFEQEEIRNFLRQDGAGCDLAVCALAGSLFAPNALQRIAQAFSSFSNAAIAYGDFELQAADGSLWPIALPAFDYERMLEQGYCAHLFVMRRAILERCLGNSANNLYRLFNAALDEDLSLRQAIVHLPGALATLPGIDARGMASGLRKASALHLQRRKDKASCARAEGAIFPAVRILRKAAPGRVSIAIPARNHVDRLRECLASVSCATANISAEILVMDNDRGGECLEFFSEIKRQGVRVIHATGAFNHSDLANQAANAASGEALCLLDDDLKGLEANWLEEMLGRLNGPDVGAVGPLLISSSGVVEHGGAVLGPNFAPADAFRDRLLGDCGYGDLLRVAHECSAAPSACLLVNRKDYLAVGGMDAVQFPISFGAVDLCLKLRAKGKRIIFTPHARLQRISSKPSRRGALNDAVFERELRTLRAKWGSSLAADPYYNPTLSVDPVPYSALASPPRSFAPRTNGPSGENAVLPGF